VISGFPCGGFTGRKTDYIVFEKNIVHGNAWYSRNGCSGATLFLTNADGKYGYRNIVRNNKFYDNKMLLPWKYEPNQRVSDGNGFHMDTIDPFYSGYTLIINNVAFNNGGSGISAYQNKNVDIFNNTVCANGYLVDKKADLYALDSENVRLYNNVIYSVKREGQFGGLVNKDWSNDNVFYKSNIYFGGTYAGKLGDVVGAGNVIADPQFLFKSLDPALADFRLAYLSPGVDKGMVLPSNIPLANTSITLSNTDFNGAPSISGNGIDRGAYEYNILPRIDSALTLTGRAGALTSYTIRAKNYPDSYNVAGLPAPLTINKATGVISGNLPSVAKVYNVTISATNEVGTGTATLVIDVKP
jgi:hypothetical protein